MNRLALKSIVVAALVSASAPVAAALIDFETATTDVFTDPQTHQGFEWAFSAAGWFVGPHDTASCPSCTSNGTSNLVAAGDRVGTARVTMTPSGGGSFSIFSLDAATARTDDSNILDILGTFSGGGTISTSLTIDGTFDAFSLSGFTGLSSVLFSSRNSGDYNFAGFSVDNISTTPTVPEPGTLALLGLGLAGLAATRRRKQ